MTSLLGFNLKIIDYTIFCSISFISILEIKLFKANIEKPFKTHFMFYSLINAIKKVDILSPYYNY